MFCVQMVSLFVKIISTAIALVFLPHWILPFILIAPGYSLIAAMGSEGTEIEIVYLTAYKVTIVLFLIILVIGLLCIKLTKLRRAFNVLFWIYALIELLVSFFVSHMFLKCMCVLVSMIYFIIATYPFVKNKIFITSPS